MKTKFGLLTLFAFGATTAALAQSTGLTITAGDLKSPLTSLEVCDYIASEAGGVPVVHYGVFSVCDSLKNAAFIDQCNTVLSPEWPRRKGYQYYMAPVDRSLVQMANVQDTDGGVVEFSGISATGLFFPTAPIRCQQRTRTKSNNANERVQGRITNPDFLSSRSLDPRRVWLSIEGENGGVLVKPISVAPFRLSNADAGRNLPGDDNIINVELSDNDAKRMNVKHPDLMKRCKFVLHYGDQCDIVGESLLISRCGPIKGAVIKGGHNYKFYVGHVTLIKQ
jgi:hypothetical protein